MDLESYTVNFLKEHRKELDALAKAVMKHETLSTEEITEVLSKAGDRKIA